MSETLQRGVFCSQMGGQRCQVQGAVDVLPVQWPPSPCWQGVLVSFGNNLPHLVAWWACSPDVAAGRGHQ